MMGIAVEGAIQAAMGNDFDDIIESFLKRREEIKFDLVALLRDQDDGACQIWYQPLQPDKSLNPAAESGLDPNQISPAAAG